MLLIPKAMFSSVTTSSMSPSMYLIILLLEASHVFLTSGLNLSIAGLITGKNFLSTFEPEDSVIDVAPFIKYLKDSLPTRITQS